MIKTVKVGLPINKPKETIELCDFIIAKHTLDGASSALAGVIDMTAFGNLVTDAKDKRHQAVLKDRSAQDKYDDASVKTGTGKGQRKDVKDTVLWYIRQIKDLLLVIHSGHEEAITEYGYNVVITQTGSRKNVRITLPVAIDGLLELAADIIARHTLLGMGSPLTAALVDMTAFGTLVTDATTLMGEWTVLRGEVQALNNDALNTIGYGAGQTSSTAGTIYNIVGNIRTRLLQKHQGREEALSNWGFSVKISEHGRKKGAQKISLQGKVTDKATNAVIANALVHLVEPDVFTTSGADGGYSFYSIAPGTYTVQAHKTGYPDFEATDVQIKASPLTLNIKMDGFITIIRQGDVPPMTIVNIPVNGINGTPLSQLLSEITGAPLRFYAAANATDGPGAVYYDGQIGQAPFNLDAFKVAIGYGPGKQFVNVQNMSAVAAHFLLTFSNLAP